MEESTGKPNSIRSGVVSYSLVFGECMYRHQSRDLADFNNGHFFQEAIEVAMELVEWVFCYPDRRPSEQTTDWRGALGIESGPAWQWNLNHLWDGWIAIWNHTSLRSRAEKQSSCSSNKITTSHSYRVVSSLGWVFNFHSFGTRKYLE